MKMKWMFLDLGWTLVDETEAHRARLATVTAMLAGFGQNHSVNELMALCEQAATDFAPSPFDGMLTRLHLSDAQRAAVKSAARYAKGKERLYPGVTGLLERLSENFKLAVIANQSEGTEARLAAWAIREHFALVYASTECGVSKPDPRIFAAALSAARCAPEEAVMVGDRLDNDIGPAKAQGWKTIRVLQGFSRHQRPRSPHEVPDATILGITELTANQASHATSEPAPGAASSAREG